MPPSKAAFVFDRQMLTKLMVNAYEASFAGVFH
jgi:hypothetical protein